MPLYRCWYPKQNRVRAMTFYSASAARADDFAKRILQPGIVASGGGLVYRVERIQPANKAGVRGRS